MPSLWREEKTKDTSLLLSGSSATLGLNLIPRICNGQKQFEIGLTENSISSLYEEMFEFLNILKGSVV